MLLRRVLLPAALLLGAAQAHGGLVEHYTFNETSGTTAADSSGNGNTGTLTNMADSESTTGKVGGALDFDGTNDFVSIADDASLNATTALTISAWVKTSSNNTQFVVTKFNHNSGVGSDDSYHMHIESSGVTVGRVEVNWAAGSIAVNDGQWHHLTYVFDKPTSYLYVDGVYDSGGTYPTFNSNINNSSEPVYIGRRNNNGTPDLFFTGIIDDVRIYNSALSASEVSVLAGAAPEPAETFAFLGLLTAFGLGFREWCSRRQAKTA